MEVNTTKENLRINKLVSTKKEVIFVEGDMIVPDSKPDILSTICTSGVVCLYKKEVLDEKIRIDGNINTYIMYLADDSKDKVRGINTSLDFSETIGVSNCEENMNAKLSINLKSIEAKVINGRKINIKATLEVDIKIYSDEEVDIINDLIDAKDMQTLKNTMVVNSKVGSGETKIYAKDTIAINSADNLAEILKSDITIGNKDIKISYNKILTKADANVKIMYLTEDNRINVVTGKVPVVGFIDIDNVSDTNICDVDYEIRNVVLKPNSVEEHSIYVEIEIGATGEAFEEKEINVIEDLYNPCENIEFNKKQVSTMTNKLNNQELKQIREKVKIEDLNNRTIVDVDVNPVINKENKLDYRIVYEGEIELKFILEDGNSGVDTKTTKIPFEYVMENVTNSENISNNMSIEVQNQDFIIQDGGEVVANIDMMVNNNSYKTANLNIIDQIDISRRKRKRRL